VAGDVLKNELLMYSNHTTDFSSKNHDPNGEKSVTLMIVSIIQHYANTEEAKTIRTLGNAL
jgi:hypothetical protein